MATEFPKLTYDARTDVAYLALRPIVRGEVKRTVSYSSGLIVDLDHEGKMVGIEILAATQMLPATLLREHAND